MSETTPYITIPLDKLPSKGISYPKGAEVSYRGYLFGEIQEISASKNMTYEDLLKKALTGIKTKGFGQYDLTLMDALYLGIARKLSSLGANQFVITCQCEDCGTIQDKQFTQSDISFIDIEAEESPLVFSLSNNKEYELSPTTVQDFFDLLSNGKHGKEFGKSLAKNPTAIYAAMVRNHTFKDVYTEFFSLKNMDDIELLKEVDKMFHHGLAPLEVTCANTSCKEQFTIELEGKEPLMRPFRDGGNSVRDRIRVRSKQDSGRVPHQEAGVLGSDVPEQPSSSTSG